MNIGIMWSGERLWVRASASKASISIVIMPKARLKFPICRNILEIFRKVTKVTREAAA